MSVHLTWAPVPTEPTHLGEAGQAFKAVLLHALRREDAYAYTDALAITEFDLMSSPVIVRKEDVAVVAYLQGVLDATTNDPHLRSTLATFLGHLAQYGALQIGAES